MSQSSTSAVESSSETSRFFPSHGWLFLRIYCSQFMADRLLREGSLGELIDAASGERQSPSWFFVRYADPDDHLRVRICGVNWHDAGTIVRRLGSLESSHGIHRLCIDTYVRETWRYGGEAVIEAAEAFFCADTRFVLSLSSAHTIEASPQTTLAIVAIGIMQLMQQFELSVAQSLALISSACSAYEQELRPSGPFQNGLGLKFRSARDSLLKAIEDPESTLRGLPTATRRAYADRGRLSATVFRDLTRSTPHNELQNAVGRVLLSLVHMFCNRLFPKDQRLNEYVALDQLRRSLSGMCARNQTHEH